ncbi:hypothetical protein HKX48_004546 [Thoreauomyces humboldtii]|nr:hypothetical protein HKX48_004546 [Thoreauomyces humboldtii]
MDYLRDTSGAVLMAFTTLAVVAVSAYVTYWYRDPEWHNNPLGPVEWGIAETRTNPTSLKLPLVPSGNPSQDLSSTLRPLISLHVPNDHLSAASHTIMQFRFALLALAAILAAPSVLTAPLPTDSHDVSPQGAQGCIKCGRSLPEVEAVVAVEQRDPEVAVAIRQDEEHEPVTTDAAQGCIKCGRSLPDVQVAIARREEPVVEHTDAAQGCIKCGR